MTGPGSDMKPRRPGFHRYAWPLLRKTFLFGEEAASRSTYGILLVVALGALVPLVGHLLGRVHWPIWITPVLYVGGVLVSLVRAGYVMWADAEVQRVTSEARWTAELEALRPSPMAPAPSLDQFLSIEYMPLERRPARGYAGPRLGERLTLQLKLTDSGGRGIPGLLVFVDLLEQGDQGWQPARIHRPTLNWDLRPGTSRVCPIAWAFTGSPDGPGQFVSQGNAISPGTYRCVMQIEASDYRPMTVEFGFRLDQQDGSAILSWEDGVADPFDRNP